MASPAARERAAATIREGTPADADAVVALWDALAEHGPPSGKRWRLREDAQEHWRRYLLDSLIPAEDGVLLVAEAEGAVVGYVTAKIREAAPMFAERRVLRIDTAAVDPAHQRRGVGRALFDAVLAWGRERGAASAELVTSFYNVPARAVWRHFGFEEAVVKMTRDL